MYVHIKRAADTLVAALALIILIIPGLIIAAIIKFDSKGPVFFTQARFGKDKKPFTIYKLRTMTTDTPRDCATNELVNSSSYITSVGRIMRKLSIDELPQLINVLKGDMSIVGPRPVILKETELIDARDVYLANSVRPGITGWAQANGRDEIGIYEKARLDGEYKDGLGFVMDLLCIVKTVETIIFSNGYKEGPRAVSAVDITLTPNVSIPSSAPASI